MSRLVSRANVSHIRCRLGGRPGFTLVELLLVLVILAAVAASATAMLDGVDRQPSYDLTRDRLEAIRRAIVGPEDGVPHGFASDTGRLPRSVRELLVRPTGPSTPVAEELLDPFEMVDGVGTGWRGPYLLSSNLTGSNPLFRDGWGNTDLDGDRDKLLSGWTLDPDLGTPPGLQLRVVSRGSDGTVDVGTPVDPYAVDVSRTILADDWSVDVAGQQLVVFVHDPGATISGLHVLLLTPVPAAADTLDGTVDRLQEIEANILSDVVIDALATPSALHRIQVQLPAARVSAGLRAIRVRVGTTSYGTSTFVLRPRSVVPPQLDHRFRP